MARATGAAPDTSPSALAFLRETPFDCLKGDVVRVCGEFSPLTLCLGFLRHRTLRPVLTLRMCQATEDLRPRAAAKVVALGCRGLHRWLAARAGMDLAWSTTIGAGFLVAHGWGLVITPWASIGRNVTVFHGVTIGQKDEVDENGDRTTTFPTVEDDVWIGPHAVILGGVIVGTGSRIAAHTVVTRDVPPHAIVGGNPMRVLEENAARDVFNPAPLPDGG